MNIYIENDANRNTRINSQETSGVEMHTGRIHANQSWGAINSHTASCLELGSKCWEKEEKELEEAASREKLRVECLFSVIARLNNL